MLIEEKMYRTSQPIKISYPMTAPSNGPPLPKSRGLALFDRRAASLNSDNNETSSHSILHDDTRLFPSALKPLHSFAPPAAPVSSVLLHHHHHQTYSPIAPPRRSPTQSPESYPHSSNENVQLLRIQPRPELTYIKELPPRNIATKEKEKFLETDFPFIENPRNEDKEQRADSYSLPSDTACVEETEKAFDYLHSQNCDDDDDDDVIHQPDQPYSSDSFDDEHIIDEDENSAEIIDRSANNPANEHHRHHHHHQRAAIHLRTNSTVNIDDKLSPALPPRRAPPPTPTSLQDNLTNHSSPMATAIHGTHSDDYDSDFDNSSHEDEDQQSHKESITEPDDDQQAQIQQRKRQILWSIIQEWSKKEEYYTKELEIMEQNLKSISGSSEVQAIVHRLIDKHKAVSLQIEDLHDRGRDLITLIEYLTKSVTELMSTIDLYEQYVKFNLVSIRKSLEKKLSNKDMSSEDLLCIPPKQFLQILSQVQDLYQTALTCDAGGEEYRKQLYEHAQRCKDVRNSQNENMNKIILKAEDVVVLVANKNRDRCRLILYSDAIVCCNWKTKLLASPKYTLIWFIPMADLEWSVPQESGNNSDTGDELKSNLKSAYKELESAQKSGHSMLSRQSKNLRKKENEYNIAQSKLQLILKNNGSRPNSFTILFSSNYQRQDWLDMIDKSKEDFMQRNSAILSPTTAHRLNDSLIQKRLDLLKLSSQESISSDLSSTLHSSPSNTQTKTSHKPVTGTLQIIIHSIQGSALCNLVRQSQTLPAMSASQPHMQKNFQFFVEIEIDSYNTFYPCAKTSKQSLQQQQNQQDSVKFKDEVFQIELEYALAIRLLVYRIDTSKSGNNNSLERNYCLGKFHCEIDAALNNCSRSSNRILCLESRSGDLRVELNLTHSRRDGTFKRQLSRRSLAVFGKPIETLMKTPTGLIDGIPRLIVKCVQMVEENGLDETGIYRVCCVTSNLQKLRHAFDRNHLAAEKSLERENVHVAANLLKLFFRELPEPLFTTHLYPNFLEAIKLNSVDNQDLALINTLNELPPNHRRILLYLFDHLIRVSEHSNKNMMHLDNLAVVFGPTLMRPSTTSVGANQQRTNAFSSNNGQAMQTDLDQMSVELQSSMYQCQIVLACLKLRKEGEFK